MNNWYECKVKYEKTLETGTQKKVTEAYLVDAMSFTEAENRIIEEMTPYIVGEFEVAAVKKARISELFIDPAFHIYNWNHNVFCNRSKAFMAYSFFHSGCSCYCFYDFDRTLQG